MHELCDLGSWWKMNDRPALQKLRQAMWTPVRQVDISDDLRAFEDEGYSPFPKVIEFLLGYSGLRLPIDHGGPDEIWFSGVRACNLIAPAWVEDYSDRAQTSLLPVGACHQDHLTLLLGENGSWFGGFDDEFGLIGTDVLMALDNLILNEEFVARL